MFDQLRNTTRQSHACLEKTFIAKLKTLRTADEYAGLLGTLHDFYAPVEQLVMQHVDDGILPDLQERRKVNSILRDLEVLNKKHVARQPPRLPAITNESTALGALYVTEGSTLGGQIIASMLHKQLGINSAFSFFQAYGAETNTRWNNFKQSLLAHRQKINVTEICQSAHQTFESLHLWLDKN